MKRRIIELMVVSAIFLLSPIANAMEKNQSPQPLSGPTDPLPPKPSPPSPGPTDPLPKPSLPSPGPTVPR